MVTYCSPLTDTLHLPTAGVRSIVFVSFKQELRVWERCILACGALSRAVQEENCFDIVLEVGPHPALKGPATETLKTLTGIDIPYHGVLKRNDDDVNACSDALGFVQKGFPPYCWDHDRPLFKESRRSKIWRTQSRPVDELLGKLASMNGEEVRWRNIIKLSEVERLQGTNSKDQPVSFLELQDLTIHNAIALEDGSSGFEIVFVIRVLERDSDQVIAQYSCYSGGVEANSSEFDRTIFTGRVVATLGDPTPDALAPRRVPELPMTDIDLDRFYMWLGKCGLDYSGDFLVDSTKRHLNVSTVAVRRKVHRQYRFHPATLDVAFQGFYSAFAFPGDGRLRSIYLPTSIRKVRINMATCPRIATCEESGLVVDCHLTETGLLESSSDNEVDIAHVARSLHNKAYSLSYGSAKLRLSEALSARVRPINVQGFFSDQETYFLVGLTGDVGLSLCEWTIDHGARHFALASRKQKIDAASVRHLQKKGGSLRVFSLNITDKTRLREVYAEIAGSMPPIGGVYNGAMTLRDSPLDSMSWADFNLVLQPKSNYAAENMFMASLAAQRRKRGFAASVMDIGMLLGIGLMNDAHGAVEDHMRNMDYMVISEPEFHMQRDHSVQGQLKETQDSKEALSILEGTFATKLGAILRSSSENIDKGAPLVTLGIDSLVAVEIRSWFLKELVVDVPALKILGGVSLVDICRGVLGKLPAASRGVKKDADPQGPGKPAVEKRSRSPTPPPLAGPPQTDPATSSVPTSRNTPNLTPRTSRGSSPMSDSVTDKPEGQQQPPATYERTGRMSHAQAQLYFLHEFLDDKSAYNAGYTGKLHGRLDIPRLKKAVHAVGMRHQNLRTSYFMDKSADQAIQAEYGATEIEKLKYEVFDIENGQVMKVAVLSETPSLHHMVIFHHHIALDGQSFSLFLQDLTQTYSDHIPSNSVQQTIDMAKKQSPTYTKENLHQELAFWSELYRAAPPEPLPPFPFSKVNTRQGLKSYDMHTVDFKLDANFTKLIKQAAAGLQVTTFSFYLSTLTVYLGRCLNVEDVSIGIVEANRTQAEDFQTICHFLNMLPLRSQLQSDEPFNSVAKRSRHVLFPALANARAPFDMILGHLDAPRSSSTHPLFQVAMNYRSDFKNHTPLGDDGTIEWTGGAPARNPYDLVINVTETPDWTLLSFITQEYLYERSDTELMLGWYTRALENLARNPSYNIANYPMSSETDITQSMKLGLGGAMDIAREGTLAHRIDSIAGQQPNSIALATEATLVVNLDNILSSADNIYESVENVIWHRPRSRVTNSSFGFDLILEQTFHALAMGGTLVMASKESRGSPTQLSELMLSEGVTFTHIVPSEYLPLLHYGSQTLRKCKRWHWAFSGGEPIGPELRRAFQKLRLEGLELINAYGPLETTLADSLCPSPNCSISIVDEQVNPVPIGFPGEVCISGAGIGLGYLNRPDETQRKFVELAKIPSLGAQRWLKAYRSGDRERLLPNGSLEILGRLERDSQVNLRGIRIELDEIDNVIVQTSNGTIVNFAVSLRRSLDVLAAFVVCDMNFRGDTTEFAEWLKCNLPLPPYIRPAFIIATDRIPTNANCKKNRLVIDNVPIPGEQGNAEGLDQLNAMVQSVKEVWQEVPAQRTARTAKIDANFDFFHVGGNSMLLIKTSTYEATPVQHINWNIEVAALAHGPTQPRRTDMTVGASSNLAVLLTGATGFLGKHILKRLVEDDRIKEVHCIAIRLDALGHPRHVGLKSEKVIEYSGDLSDRFLGLSESEFGFLAENIDLIVHNGADVSFLKIYSFLRRANAVSTRTLSKFTDKAALPEVSISEYLPPSNSSDGYGVSKWVSEVLLEKVSADNGLPTWIHRLSSVVGDGAPGLGLIDIIFKYARILGAIPQLDSENATGAFDQIAVKYVAKDLVDIALRSLRLSRQPEAHFVHHCSDVKIPPESLKNYLEKLHGLRLWELPMQDWLDAALHRGLSQLLYDYLAGASGGRKLVIPLIEK
ncbi:hypothetical protein DL768_008721 [Monosporascus sp. mg162]|nr:hypothetical protein DL768_008721 [Monosporascus sp. mg162]